MAINQDSRVKRHQARAPCLAIWGLGSHSPCKGHRVVRLAKNTQLSAPLAPEANAATMLAEAPKDQALLGRILAHCMAGPSSAALDRTAILDALTIVLGGSAEEEIVGTSELRPEPEAAATQAAPPGETNDSSVSALTAQVAEAAACVALLRQRIPGQVSQAVAAEVEAWRPALQAADLALTATNLTPGKTPRSAAGYDGSRTPLGHSSPAPVAHKPSAAGQLHTQLVQSLDKLPNLRARMDEVTKRMSNVVQAIEEQQALEASQATKQFTSPLKMPPSDWIVGVVAREAGL